MKFLSVILLLVSIIFSQEYNRSEWGQWIDVDKDCQDTRQELLIKQSLIPVTLSNDGCKVMKGLWFCLYTGKTITDPSQLDIDHLVPISNAFYSGGYMWTSIVKRTYFNYFTDKYHLLAVSKSANRSKQDKSPDQWMPSYQPFRCSYIRLWLHIKTLWKLETSVAEDLFIEDYIINNCR